MQEKFRLDLQFFADGAPAGDGGAAGVTSGDAGQSTGETSADAGQSIEARLEKLGVPKDKIKKGAYRRSVRTPAAEPAREQPQPEEAEGGEDAAAGGDADRRSWDEIKDLYKDEFNSEMTNAIRARIAKEQEKTQKLAERVAKLAPITDFFSEKYGLDPDNSDPDELVRKFREDSSLSEEKAAEMGVSFEVAHRLELMEQEEKRRERARREREQELNAAFKRQQINARYDDLRKQADELAGKIPGLNLTRELQNPAFVAFTQPGTGVTVEQAYYATHPEYREKLEKEAAQRAAEAVSASVRAGAMRPSENGSQAATIGRTPYRDMPKDKREDLKRRIHEAAFEGRHIPVGG